MWHFAHHVYRPNLTDGIPHPPIIFNVRGSSGGEREGGGHSRDPYTNTPHANYRLICNTDFSLFVLPYVILYYTRPSHALELSSWNKPRRKNNGSDSRTIATNSVSYLATPSIAGALLRPDMKELLPGCDESIHARMK